MRMGRMPIALHLSRTAYRGGAGAAVSDRGGFEAVAEPTQLPEVCEIMLVHLTRDLGDVEAAEIWVDTAAAPVAVVE